MEPIRFEDWIRWSGTFSRLPRVVAYPGQKLPESWLNFWDEGPTLLLESGKDGRYTILAIRIKEIITGSETEGRVNAVSPDGTLELSERRPGRPLDVIRAWLARNPGPSIAGYPPCCGGLAGMFSYDLVRTLERLPETARADIDIPLYALAVFSEGCIYDHREAILYSVAWDRREAGSPETDADHAALKAAFDRCGKTAESNAAAWIEAANAPSPTPGLAAPPPTPSVAPPAFSLDRGEFIGAVKRIQEYIAAGDTYQVNLSLRETRPLSIPAESVYEALRRINPSPYMGLLRFPGFTLVSGSPELLVRLHGDRLEARPIAGTRPRDQESHRDHELAVELMAHPKERAEHLMLVDLIRNDLGRVSRYGTVKVRDFMVLEDYSHVRHIVSHIEGRLTEGRDALDVIAATFPGGTITGAPKVRTMEIIEEFEPVRRGPYTGSIGWIGFAGDMELNIVIRTLVAEHGRAHVQAGAGIVADSVPEKEYEESLNKAKALWVAVEHAEAAAQTRTAQ